jgi:hypothetical protein
MSVEVRKERLFDGDPESNQVHDPLYTDPQTGAIARPGGLIG